MRIEVRDIGVIFVLALIFTPLMKFVYVPWLISFVGTQTDPAELSQWVMAGIFAVVPAVLVRFVLFHRCPSR